MNYEEEKKKKKEQARKSAKKIELQQRYADGTSTRTGIAGHVKRQESHDLDEEAAKYISNNGENESHEVMQMQLDMDRASGEKAQHSNPTKVRFEAVGPNGKPVPSLEEEIREANRKIRVAPSAQEKIAAAAEKRQEAVAQDFVDHYDERYLEKVKDVTSSKSKGVNKERGEGMRTRESVIMEKEKQRQMRAAI